jgi:hypothetical protein
VAAKQWVTSATTFAAGAVSAAKQWVTSATTFAPGVLTPNWTPANITPALWLDASDANTVTLSNGAPTQWNDKSGNSQNVTAQGSPTWNSVTINGLPTIGIQRYNSNFVMSNPAYLPTGTEAFTWFVVFKAASNTSSATAMFGWGNNASNGSRHTFYFTGVDGEYPPNIYISDDNNNCGYIAGFAQTFGTGTKYHIFTWPGGSSTSAQHWLNGESGSASHYFSETPNIPSQNTELKIGGLPGYGGSQFIATAYIGEIIIVKGAVSSGTRQLIDSYFASKWGASV